MGVLHAHGLFGVPADDRLAVLHLYFAALGGSAEAALALGHRCVVCLQVVVERDSRRRRQLATYKRRFSLTVLPPFALSPALSRRYRSHANGEGAPKSCATAVLYLEAAAKARADAVAASHGLLQAVPPASFTRLADANVDGLTPEASKGEGQLIGYYHNAGASRPKAADCYPRALRDCDRGAVSTLLALALPHVRPISSLAPAADRGDTHAHVALGHLYLLGAKGESTGPDVGACSVLPVGSDIRTTHFHALSIAPRLCYRSLLAGVRQDLRAAGEHFHAAAEDGESLSAANLGWMYLHGIGAYECGQRCSDISAQEAGTA